MKTCICRLPLRRIALSETVGRREAISVPTNSSIAMPRYGERSASHTFAGTQPEHWTLRMTGVSTIQHPPGAGMPVKYFFQYGRGSCSSIVLKRARRKQSHIA